MAASSCCCSLAWCQSATARSDAAADGNEEVRAAAAVLLRGLLPLHVALTGGLPSCLQQEPPGLLCEAAAAVVVVACFGEAGSLSLHVTALLEPGWGSPVCCVAATGCRSSWSRSSCTNATVDCTRHSILGCCCQPPWVAETRTKRMSRCPVFPHLQAVQKRLRHRLQPLCILRQAFGGAQAQSIAHLAFYVSQQLQGG